MAEARLAWRGRDASSHIDQKPDEIGSLERELDRAEPVEGLQEAPNEDLTEPTAPVSEVIPAEDEDWFGMKDGDAE